MMIMAVLQLAEQLFLQVQTLIMKLKHHTIFINVNDGTNGTKAFTLSVKS